MAGDMKMLATVFVLQAKETFSREDSLKLVEVVLVLSLGSRDPGMFMLCAMAGQEVALGLI